MNMDCQDVILSGCIKELFNEAKYGMYIMLMSVLEATCMKSNIPHTQQSDLIWYVIINNPGYGKHHISFNILTFKGYMCSTSRLNIMFFFTLH